MSDEFELHHFAVLNCPCAGWWCVCVCLCVCSHLSFLLDFEELGHVREVFLVGFSHLLLCSLRVHDLQPLRTRAEELLIKINLHSAQGTIMRCTLLFTCRGVNATLELVPEERSLTVDFPPYVMLCFCNVLCCVQQKKRLLETEKK